MDLSFITKNPVIKNLAFGQLKKAFNESSLTLIAVSMGADGELKFDTYDEPVKVLKETEIQTLVNLATL